MTIQYRPPPPPARQSLASISEAAAKFLPSDFYKVPFVGLKFADVKEVGSYMLTPGEPAEFVAKAKLPTYVTPMVGQRLEKEKGVKRTPRDDELYKKYVELRTNLGEAVQKLSLPMDKDFVADRSALLLLLNYLGEAMTPDLMQHGQALRALDLVKISKAPNGKALVLEKIFEKKNLWAEFRHYHGGWKRSEVSQRGWYFPALERLATGDDKTKTQTITGLKQIAGTTAGTTNRCFRFVEYNLGGVSFLVRATVHGSKDGKNVELQPKNWYFRQQATALDTLYRLLLGGTDMLCLALQRSGKLVQVEEVSVDSLLAKQPLVMEAAERRLGRLVALLNKVKTICAGAGEGPWVLQWQRGELVLGKYEKVEVEEEAPQPEPAEELQFNFA